MNGPIRIPKLTKGRKVAIPIKYFGADLISVVLEKRNKAGDLIYPYVYQIERVKALQYPTVTEPGGRYGVPSIEVPLSHFRKIGKRVEFDLQEGETVRADDPAIQEWRDYL